jgi:hypothetical protein
MGLFGSANTGTIRQPPPFPKLHFFQENRFLNLRLETLIGFQILIQRVLFITLKRVNYSVILTELLTFNYDNVDIYFLNNSLIFSFGFANNAKFGNLKFRSLFWQETPFVKKNWR